MNNVTMIKDLPDLSDMTRDESPEKYNKYIRDNYVPLAESGMNPRYATIKDTTSIQPRMEPVSENYKSIQPQGIQPQGMQPKAMQPRAMQPRAMQPRDESEGFENYKRNYYVQSREGYEGESHTHTHTHTHSGPTCLDVINHIDGCRICSKFYKSNQTVYLLCIMALSILVLILFKKLLDCN